MKKIFTFVLFTVIFTGFSSDAFAQGNLQFNQVILFDMAPSAVQTIVIPAGKVWKIESIGMGFASNAASIYLRNASGANITYFSASGSSNTAVLPFWLPAGFTGSFINNYSTYRATISIIEFNVVP